MSCNEHVPSPTVTIAFIVVGTILDSETNVDGAVIKQRLGDEFTCCTRIINQTLMNLESLSNHGANFRSNEFNEAKHMLEARETW